MYDVICAGQAVLDCVTRGREADAFRADVYRAESIKLRVGGDAANEARILAGLGFDVAVICGLGQDLAGSIIRQELEKTGVCMDLAGRLDRGTPVANIEVYPDGSRNSVSSPATRLEGYRIDPETVTGTRVLSLASIFRPPFEDPELLCSIISSAKSSGTVVCADTKLPLSEDVRLEHYKESLRLVDYIFPNEKEAAYYSGKDKLPEMADYFRDLGIRNVVIKAGPLGCYVNGTESSFALPAVKVDKVVDTTGAGDSFVAGFIAGILRGMDLRECAESGLKQAARTISEERTE